MTIIEVIVFLALALVIIGGIYQILIGQNRLYSKQRELMDVRMTLRSTAAVLTSELRMLSAAGGDLVVVDQDSIVIRSIVGSGILCGIDSLGIQHGLAATSGEFSSTANDSVLIYDASAGADPWVVTGVDQVISGGGGDVPNCDWGPVTETVLAMDTLDGSTLSGVVVGAPVLAFRQVAYGLFQSDGRWWLGRRVGASGTYEILTGPMRSPTDSGLAFFYFDSTSAATMTAADVRRVEVLLRGESLKATRQTGGGVFPQQDTLRTRVFLRG